MALPKEERIKLKKKLPYGSQSKVARQLGTTRSRVYQYIVGINNDLSIEDALVSVLKEEKKRNKRIVEIING